MWYFGWVEHITLGKKKDFWPFLTIFSYGLQWPGRQMLLRRGSVFWVLKFFFRLFPVDKTLLYENPYDRVWGVLGNSSYKPFYNDLSPLENISNLCVSHFSWKQSKQWTIVGYIYYMIYVTQYIHKKVWWNVFQMMGYAPL